MPGYPPYHTPTTTPQPTPPFALCLYPLQASWHPLHKMRTAAHHSEGTRFLFLEGLWNSVARLPVEGPRSHLSCGSTFCPWPQDRRSTIQRSAGVSLLFELSRNYMWKTGKNLWRYIRSHMHRAIPRKRGGPRSVRNEGSVSIRVKTYRVV